MTPGDSAVFGSRESHSVSASKSKVSMTAQRAPFGHGDDGIRFVKVPSLCLPRTPERQAAPDDTPGTYWTPVSGHRHCLGCARSTKTCRHWNVTSVHGLLDFPARAREGGERDDEAGQLRAGPAADPPDLDGPLDRWPSGGPRVGRAGRQGTGQTHSEDRQDRGGRGCRPRDRPARGRVERHQVQDRRRECSRCADAAGRAEPPRQRAWLRGHLHSARAHREAAQPRLREVAEVCLDRKSTRLNSSHVRISYAVFCLKKKKKKKKKSS